MASRVLKSIRSVFEPSASITDPTYDIWGIAFSGDLGRLIPVTES